MGQRLAVQSSARRIFADRRVRMTKTRGVSRHGKSPKTGAPDLKSRGRILTRCWALGTGDGLSVPLRKGQAGC